MQALREMPVPSTSAYRNDTRSALSTTTSVLTGVDLHSPTSPTGSSSLLTTTSTTSPPSSLYADADASVDDLYREPVFPRTSGGDMRPINLSQKMLTSPSSSPSNSAVVLFDHAATLDSRPPTKFVPTARTDLLAMCKGVKEAPVLTYLIGSLAPLRLALQTTSPSPRQS